MNFRLQRAKDWDAESTDRQSMSSDMQPRLIDSIAVDPEMLVPFNNDEPQEDRS